MRRFHPWFSLGLATVALHATLLFVVIPQISSRVTALYNQDRFTDGYDELATNLAQGNGYRFYPDTALTMMREPGYPVFLAGLMLVFGPTFTAVKLANMCLALATAWLILLLARRMSNRPMMTIAAPLLFLFHPATLIAESRGSVEILFTFLVTLFFVVLYSALERNTRIYYVLTGAALGLAVLVRSTPMLFPFLLLGYLLVFERKRIPALSNFRNIAVMVIAMLAILSPWIIRNYRLTGRFVPTASVLGVSAHAGEYICEHRSDDQPWVLLDRAAAQERSKLALEKGYRFKDGYYQAFYSTSDELSFSGYLAGRVFTEYEKHPLLCVKCVSYNLFNFWFAGKSWRSTALNMLAQLPYLVLAFVGGFWCVKNKRLAVIGPMLLFIGYVMAVHLPILAQARYSVPLIPLLSILAAFGLIAFRDQWVRPGSKFEAEEFAAGINSPDRVDSLVGSGREK